MINDFSISDNELIYMFLQGSQCSLDRLLGYYEKLIWKRSHEALAYGDIESADVEDFFQEGVIGFYQALYGFRPDLEVGLAFYIDMCVKSSIKTFQRKHRTKSYRMISSRNSLDLHIAEDESMTLLDTIACNEFSNCPQNMAVYHEISEIRNRFVSSLPKCQQKVFKLHEEGYTYKEIAQLVGLSDKDVDNIVQKIRRYVKKEYNYFER